MASAKITRCKHFFHGVCLRKWLYVQDRCPLCHEIMMYHDGKPDEKDEQPADNRAIDNSNRRANANVSFESFPFIFKLFNACTFHPFTNISGSKFISVGIHAKHG